MMLRLAALAGAARGFSAPTVCVPQSAPTASAAWSAEAAEALCREGVVVLRREAGALVDAGPWAGRAVGGLLDLGPASKSVHNRGARRFDYKVEETESWDDADLCAAARRFVDPVCRAFFEDARYDCVIRGCVVSLPGSAAQGYHTDGPQRFVNVFVPLVDVDASNGPTEFALGTHDAPVGSVFVAADGAVTRTGGIGGDDSVRLAAPDLNAGDLILFDYRVLHRGLANPSDAPRPVYYLTFAPPGQQDLDNFQNGGRD